MQQLKSLQVYKIKVTINVLQISFFQRAEANDPQIMETSLFCLSKRYWSEILSVSDRPATASFS